MVKSSLAPIEECMGKGRAFRAIDEFLSSGERPGWLDSAEHRRG